jgi:hypothetical protein
LEQVHIYRRQFARESRSQEHHHEQVGRNFKKEFAQGYVVRRINNRIELLAVIVALEK